MAGQPSGGYPSLGTIGSNTSMSHQQFGLQHLNPMAHLNSLAHQQQQQQSYAKQKAYGSQSTYGHYGPSSLNTMCTATTSLIIVMILFISFDFQLLFMSAFDVDNIDKKRNFD